MLFVVHVCMCMLCRIRVCLINEAYVIFAFLLRCANWTHTGGHILRIKTLIFAWFHKRPVCSSKSAQYLKNENDYHEKMRQGNSGISLTCIRGCLWPRCCIHHFGA